MKRTVLSIAAILIGSIALNAQWSDQNNEPIFHAGKTAKSQSGLTDDVIKEPFADGTRGGGNNNSTQAFGDTLFAETFGNGLNGDPGNGTWTNAGSAPWEYRGPSTSPDINTGSRGAYVGTRGAINSPTHSNGFMIFDSDYQDNGGNSSNMGSGPNPTPHMGMLESPSMDFSGYTQIYMTMSSYFRRFQGTCYVTFSIDGGTTWNDTLHIYTADNRAVNTATDNADQIATPIPSSVSGNPNVIARIVFDGVTESNVNGSGYYFWQVDDVYFVEAPDNDLAVDQIYYSSPASIGNVVTSKLYYGQIPQNHAAADTFRFGADVRNKGASSQTNTKVDMYLNGILELSTSSTTLPPSATDSIGAVSSIGLNKFRADYSMDFVVSSDVPDDLPADDTMKTTLSITDTAYSWVSRDNINDFSTYFPGISSYSIGGLVNLHAVDTITSIDFYVSQGNVGDPEIILTVWKVEPNSVNPIVQSFEVLSSSITGQWVNFPVTETPVQPGHYLVGWESVGDTIRWGTDARSVNNDLHYLNTSNQFQRWVPPSMVRAPAIQLNMKGPDCPVITGQITSTTEAGCGLGDGEATVVPDNPSHSIAWPDGSSGQTNSNLHAGVYQVSIIDNNNCVGTVEVVINNLNAPTATGTGIEISNPISCHANNAPSGSQLANDGVLTPTFTGGSAPYTYSWSNNQTTTSDDPNNGALLGLSIGSYRVTVTDSANCEAFSNGFTTLMPPSQMSVEVDHTPRASNLGLITTDVTNGVPPFSYQWNTGATTDTVPSSQPEPFTYKVTVTDNNSCVTEGEHGPFTSVPQSNIQSNINVYPNPNNGEFNVEFTDLSGNYTITVRNIVGQIVGQERVNVRGSNIARMSYDNLTGGLYLLEVNSDKGERVTYKITVK